MVMMITNKSSAFVETQSASHYGIFFLKQIQCLSYKAKFTPHNISKHYNCKMYMLNISSLSKNDLWIGQHLYLYLKCSLIVNNLQNRDGKVTRKDFRQIVERFTFRLEDGQFKELMNRLGVQNSSRVSYHAFLNLFEQKESLKVNFYT